MKPWHKYGILAATATLSSILAGLIAYLLSGVWPEPATSVPYMFAGYFIVLVWYLLFVHRPHLDLAKNNAELKSELEKRSQKPMPSETYNKIIEHLATGIASVYDNEPNDTYREKAKEIYPEVFTEIHDIVYAEMEVEAELDQENQDFLNTLKDERTKTVKNYGERVRADLPALAKNEWEGVERLTRLIEQEKERIKAKRLWQRGNGS